MENDLINGNLNTNNNTNKSRNRWMAYLVFAALFAFLSLIAWGMQRSQSPILAVGSPAPEFTLTLYDGQTVSLQSLKGKTVLLNFWASWCGPCEQEAGHLQSAWQTYAGRDDVVFIGPAYADTEKNARTFLSKHAITYLNGADRGSKISDLYRVRGVPETFIINADGNLAAIKIGPFNSASEITGLINPIIEAGE